MRAFIAVKVPENEKINVIISALKKIMGLKTVEPNKLHVTLKFLGDISDEKAAEVSSSLETLRGFGPFDISVKGVGTFPEKGEPRVVWTGAESNRLAALNERVEKEMEQLGFEREKRAFTAHVTLARAKSRVTGELKGILTQDEFFSFSATTVSLIKSEATPGGYVYYDVKTVEL